MEVLVKASEKNPLVELATNHQDMLIKCGFPLDLLELMKEEKNYEDDDNVDLFWETVWNLEIGSGHTVFRIMMAEGIVFEEIEKEGRHSDVSEYDIVLLNISDMYKYIWTEKEGYPQPTDTYDDYIKSEKRMTEFL